MKRTLMAVRLAVLLSMLLSVAIVRAEVPPLPAEPVADRLNRVFVGHMNKVAELIKHQPPFVRPYLDDMFSITNDILLAMEALDPLCRVYPQADSHWRKTSFLPYALGCRKRIQADLGILATTANTNLPNEVRREARLLREDIQKMAEWIEVFIVAANSTPEAKPESKASPSESL